MCVSHTTSTGPYQGPTDGLAFLPHPQASLQGAKCSRALSAPSICSLLAVPEPPECQSFLPGCSSSRTVASLQQGWPYTTHTVPRLPAGLFPRPLFLGLCLLPINSLPAGSQGKTHCSMGTEGLVLSFLSLTPLPHSTLSAQVPPCPRYSSQPSPGTSPVGSGPCSPAAWAKAWAWEVYSLLQVPPQALTAPRHHLTSGFMCSFPGFFPPSAPELSTAAQEPHQRQTRFLGLMLQWLEEFLCPQQVDQQHPSWALFLAHSLDLSSYPTSTPSLVSSSQTAPSPFPTCFLFPHRFFADTKSCLKDTSTHPPGLGSCFMDKHFPLAYYTS